MIDSRSHVLLFRCSRRLLLTVAFSVWGALPGLAQSVNSGAISFTAGMDLPSVYVFRGIVREQDPKLTVAPYGTLTFGLRGTRAAQTTGEVAAGDVAFTLGLWNSLNTGSSGSGGFTEHIHFEEDFSAGLTLGLGGRLTVATTFSAYTSPNFQFDTIKEVNVKVAHGGWLRPYATIASDLGDGTFDSGRQLGTYLEVGARPTFHPWRAVALTVPVTLGASVQDYYELNNEDHRFGFVDVGGLVAIPLGGVPTRFGAWQLRGGVDFYRFGEFGRAANRGNANRVVASAGLAMRY